MKNFALTIFIIISCIVLLELFLTYNHYAPNYQKYRFDINGTINIVNDDPNDFYADNRDKKVFLGDSFTVNKVCAHDNDDFVSIIQKKLNNKKTAYYNFASLADSTPEYLNIANHLKDKIDTLIVVLYYNDIFIGKKTCRTMRNLEKFDYELPNKCNEIYSSGIDNSNDNIIKKIDNFLEFKIKSYRLIKEASVNLPYVNSFFNRKSWTNLYLDTNSEENIFFIKILKDIQALGTLHNFHVIFTYFPDVVYLEKDNPSIDDWSSLINRAKKNGIVIHDPWDFFISNKKATNMSWSLVDDHPNCEANSIMAEFLIKEVL